jgi:hypothetical protein
MACTEYKALLPEHAEGNLSAEQERLLKDHLRDCDSCRSTLRLLRMEDKSIRGALLGIRPKGTTSRPPRQGYRVVLFGTIGVVLALVALYGAYRGVGRLIQDDSGPWGEIPALPETETLDESLRTEIVWDGFIIGDALDAISEATKVDVVVDPPSLPVLLEGHPRSIRNNGPAREVLTAVLRPAGLTWDLRFGVILVGTPERLAALPVEAPPLPPALSRKSVSLSYAGLPLSHALDALSRLKGLEIVLTARVADFAAEDRVTIDFTDLGLRDALSLILIPRGLTYREVGGMIVVARRKKAH